MRRTAHAEVVKKFGVEIRAKAGLVGHEEVEQRGMNLPGADVRTDRRRQIHPGLREVAAHRGADSLQHHAKRAFGTRLDAGTALDHRHEPLVDLFVAAQARQRDHSRQRLPGAARRRQPGLARLDPQARDRLAAIVEDVEQRTVLLGVGLREAAAARR